MGHAQLKYWKGHIYICLESAQTIWSCVHTNVWHDRCIVYIFVHVCMVTSRFSMYVALLVRQLPLSKQQ
jgi:hypothetical protein